MTRFNNNNNIRQFYVLHCFYFLLLLTFYTTATAELNNYDDDGRIIINDNIDEENGKILGITDEEYYRKENNRNTSNVEYYEQERILSSNDFLPLNTIIENAIIRLPDTTLRDSTYTIHVSNLRCYNFQIDDIELVSSRMHATIVAVVMKINGLSMNCYADYFFDGWWFWDSRGTVSVDSYNNDATTVTAFTSKNFDYYPPTTSDVNQCTPNFNINRINFSGSFFAWALNIIENLFRNYVEGQVRERICTELAETNSIGMNDMLQKFQNTLNVYNNVMNDPLHPEKLIERQTDSTPGNDIQLLNLREKETTMGFWMNEGLQDLVSYLNTEVVTSTGEVDSNINVILREQLLSTGGQRQGMPHNEKDDNSFFNRNSDVIFDLRENSQFFSIHNNDGNNEQEESIQIYENHNKITETSIVVNNMKLVGLDTLITFDPFIYIGNYTLKSNIEWENLSFEFDINVFIAPSTLSTSYIENPTDIPSITENNVKVKFNISNLKTLLTFFLPIDKRKLEELKIGYFLNSTNMIPCLLSTVYEKVQISSLSIDAFDISSPIISGFVSNGIDKLISKSIQSIFLMYEGSLLKASNGFFQVVIRDMLNTKMINKYNEYNKQEGCSMLELPPREVRAVTTNQQRHEQQIVSSMLDFRDLFLPANESIIIGGSGTERYGDLFSSFIMPNIHEHLLKDDKINSRIIRPLTKMLSGSASDNGESHSVLEEEIGGDISFFQSYKTNPMFHYSKESVVRSSSSTTTISNNKKDYGHDQLLLWDNQIDFIIYNGTVHNIDTFTSPLILVQPIEKSNELSNIINIGPVESKPLTFTMHTMTLVEQQQQSSNNASTQTDNTDYNDYVEEKDSSSALSLLMNNEFEIRIEIPSSTFSFNFLASINETSLLHYPLKDTTNINCWLSTIMQQQRRRSLAAAEGYTDTTAINEESTFFPLKDFRVNLSSFLFNVSCVSCTSIGLYDILPETFHELEKAGLSSLLLPRFENLFEEFVVELWNKMNIDDLLANATMFCPHASEYNEEKATEAAANSAPYDYGSLLRDVTLSKEAVETIVTTGILSSNAAAVIIAKNYLYNAASHNQHEQQSAINYDSSLPTSTITSGMLMSPFSSNNITNASVSSSFLLDPSSLKDADVRLLDWTSISGNIGSWAENAFERARDYIEDVVIDDDDNSVDPNRDFPGEEGKERRRLTNNIFEFDRNIFDLRANVLIRHFVLNEDGAFAINFEKDGALSSGINIPGGGRMSLKKIHIWGLDSMIQLETLVPIGPQTLNNNFQLESLQIKFYVDVEHVASNTTEEMTIMLTMQDINLATTTLLAIDLNKLGGIELGAIIHIEDIVPCLLVGAHEFDILRFLVDVGSIDIPEIEGFISPHLQIAVASVIQHFFERYRTDLIYSIPHVFDTTVRAILNSQIRSYLYDNTKCSIDPNIPREGFIDFRDFLLSKKESKIFGGTGASPYGNLFPTVYEMLNEKLFDLDTTNINTLIMSLTKKQSNINGTILFPGDVFETNKTLRLAGLEADVTFKVSDVSLFNADSLRGPVELLHPVMLEPNTLNSNASFGVGGKSLRFEARILVAASDGDEMQIRNEVNVQLELDTFSVFASLILHIANKAFLSFPLRDLPDFNCLLSTLRGISLADHGVSIDNFDFNVTCVSCTSPKFDELISHLYAPDDVEEAVGIIQNASANFLDGYPFQAFLDQVVKDASRACPHSEQYDPTAQQTAEYLRDASSNLIFDETFQRDSKAIAYILSVNCIVAACLLLLLCLGKWIVNRKNRSWIESLSGEGISLLRRQEAKERERKALLDEATASMYHSPCIPKKMRFLVPIVILANIGLYLGGHLGVMSTLNIDVQLAGETFTIHRFLEFSFLDSTIKTYQNGGMEFSVMMWIFMGIWPYVKLLSSFFIWFVPPRILPVSSRERVLLWLEALTKLSMVDVITVMITFAVILVFIGGRDEGLSTDGEFYTMKLIVVPAASCYCLIIAQRMTRVSSRIFLDYHYQIVDVATKACERSNIVDAEVESNESSSDTENRYDASVSGSDHEQPTAPTAYCMSLDGETTYTVGDSPNNAIIEVPNNAIIEVDSIAEEREGDNRRRMEVYFRLLRKHLVVIFAGLTVLVLAIIGCIYAPSIAIETTDVVSLALESGTTYNQVAAEYGVFSLVSAVLLKARFVLDTASDYVGFGFLLTVGVISVGMTFFVGCYQFCRRLLDKGWRGIFAKVEQTGYSLPSYCRLHAYDHMEIYVVSVVVGCWQLGSIASYGIHLYCTILHSVFQVLVNVSLVEHTNAQCFREQILLPDNLVILLGSFAILAVKFSIQAIQQYRKNISHAYTLIHEEDAEYLSTVWNINDKSKDRNLNLAPTASFSDNSYDDELPSGGKSSNN